MKLVTKDLRGDLVRKPFVPIIAEAEGEYYRIETIHLGNGQMDLQVFCGERLVICIRNLDFAKTRG